MVGVANTAIDFAMLFLLVNIGVSMVWANMISTSIALAFSFFMNRSFTFGASGSVGMQIVKFLGVTLIGLWLLQPLVIAATMSGVVGAVGEEWGLFIGKGCATVVSMLWNYFLYDKFVFTETAGSDQQ